MLRGKANIKKFKPIVLRLSVVPQYEEEDSESESESEYDDEEEEEELEEELEDVVDEQVDEVAPAAAAAAAAVVPQPAEPAVQQELPFLTNLNLDTTRSKRNYEYWCLSLFGRPVLIVKPEAWRAFGLDCHDEEVKTTLKTFIRLFNNADNTRFGSEPLESSTWWKQALAAAESDEYKPEFDKEISELQKQHPPRSEAN